MSARARRAHLLAYDIREPKRLIRVHRCMRRWGVPVQYSVFIGYWNARELQTLLAELEEIIEPVDDVRVYALPERCDPFMLGAPLFPAGVLLAGDRPMARIAEESKRAANGIAADFAP